MRSFSVLVAALAAAASAAPLAAGKAKVEARSTPSVYLAGDSTMAKGGGGSGTQGWGQYLQYSLSIPVYSYAIAGRSARSYTREGRFQTLINTVKSGDFVIIEFGHNDGGSPTPTDNGRSDCPGADSETCATTYNGVAETVQTFPTYLKNATHLLTAKGAHVILSSTTPDNPDQTGKYAYTASRFTTYAQAAAADATIISPGTASFVDHGTYVADVYKTMTASAVDALFPKDHTHTSPVGADLVHKAFVKSVRCSDNLLASYVKNSTSSITGSCV
ncbi:hypothetical protein MBLNU459_g1974t1 [Dothideomycetes sp. NU459]